MKGIKLLATLLLASSLFVSCGEKKNSSSEEGSKYYAQFITSNNGVPMEQDLDLKLNQNISQALGMNSFAQNSYTHNYKIRLDTNGSYFIYATMNNSILNLEELENFNPLTGTWHIEGDRIILEGFAESIPYDSDRQIGTNNFYSSFNQVRYTYEGRCFALELKSQMSIAAAYDNSTNVNINTFGNGYNTGLNSVMQPGAYEVCRN